MPPNPEGFDNRVDQLPALPDAWESGAVKGLVARGNFVVDIEWKAGRMTIAHLLSRNGGLCTVRNNQPFTVKGINIRCVRSNIGFTLTFSSEKGKSYELTRE